MNKIRHILVVSLLLISITAFAGKDTANKNEKGLQHRVSALEASREFLLRRDGSTGSPDCGLFYHFETPYWDAPEYIGQGKDTFPPSFSGDYSGDLTAIVVPQADEVDTCNSDSIPPATSPTDIVAIQRGDCPFYIKAQNAADNGYGAVLIINSPDNIDDNGSRRVIRMSSPDGVAPFPIPTMMISYFDFSSPLGTAFAEGPVPIFIEGESSCTPLNASAFSTE